MLRLASRADMKRKMLGPKKTRLLASGSAGVLIYWAVVAFPHIFHSVLSLTNYNGGPYLGQNLTLSVSHTTPECSKTSISGSH